MSIAAARSLNAPESSRRRLPAVRVSIGRIAPSATLAAAAFAAAFAMGGGWCRLAPDSLIYLGAARSLWETGCFADQRLIHPPGFATLLAPLTALGDMPSLAIRILLTTCLAASAILARIAYRRDLGDRAAWCVGLLVATSPCLVRQTGVVLSEPVYLALSLGALACTARWRAQPARGTADVIAAASCASAAVLVRSAGLVLGPVMVLAVLSQPRSQLRLRARRASLFICIFLLPLAAWQFRQSLYPPAYGYGHVWTRARPSEDTPATGLALQAQRFGRFAPLRLEDIKSAMLPRIIGWKAFAPPVDRPLTWLIGGLVVGSSIWRALRWRSGKDCYALLMLAMLCLWPWDEEERLVSPLVPIFLANLIWWMRAARSRWSRFRWVRPVTGACLGLITFVHVAELAAIHARTGGEQAKHERLFIEMRRMAECQAALLPENAGTVCIMPRQNNLRVLAAGAAYLARRPIAAFHDLGSGEAPPELSKAPYLLAHRGSAALRFPVEYDPIAECGPFTLLRRRGGTAGP